MELMTEAEMCLALKVSRRTVYRMMIKGNLPAARKIGNFRQLYVTRLDFEKACRKSMR